MPRIEHDFLGDREIADDVYYGVQTARGVDNFKIMERPNGDEPMFPIALAYVKKASILSNKELGAVPADVADALVWACDQVIAGKYRDQFVTDWIQGGAGTSTNMNTNEVLCNIALEHIGGKKGDYARVSPNDHANYGQSTNDAYPTALHLAMILRSRDVLAALQNLRDAFRCKAVEYDNDIKMGRTHLQDAVPMSIGSELRAWGDSLQDEIECIRHAMDVMEIINIGGTAIGTGVTTKPGFASLACRKLGELTGINFRLADNLISATSDCGSYLQLSAALRNAAVKLTKICNDLRLLASGPRTGLYEIALPQMQPGSSIMPGKVNPVIPEVCNQTCFLVIGLDQTVMLAASAGQLQLNVMEPVISYAIFTMQRTLTNAVNALRTKCIEGMEYRTERTKELVHNSLGIITVLKPVLGYGVCSATAKQGYKEGKSLHQLIVEEKALITEEEYQKYFSNENLMTNVPR